MTIVGIIIGIILLSVLMIVHELGHFVAGRLLGFKIEQFSLFMGPVLFERVKNGIRYNVKAFPIGASVSFAGESETLEGQKGDSGYSADDPGLFHNRPRWARAIVVVMGPAINFITAIIAFVIIFSWQGAFSAELKAPQDNTLASSYGIQAGDRIVSINGNRITTDLDYTMTMMTFDAAAPLNVEVKKADGTVTPIRMLPEVLSTKRMIGISTIQDNDRYVVRAVSPASNNNNPVIKVGDEILAIADIPYAEWDKISRHINRADVTSVEVALKRDGKMMFIKTAPGEMPVYKGLGLVMTLSHSFGDIMSQSFTYPVSIVRSTFKGLGMLFSGELTAKESFAGPIGIVSMVGDVVKQEQPVAKTIQQLLMFFGLISVAVGFTNLLPIPPFDGNHLLILAIEGAARRDIPQKVKNGFGYVGLVLVLALTFYVLFIDISRLMG